MKIKIELKNRWTGNVLFELETDNNNVKTTLLEAIKQGTYLRGADLQGADLQGADLRGADLQGADLRGAYLQGAYLQGADLQGADLRGAYLQGADLRGAYLQGADLQGAYLRCANVFTGLYTYVVIPYITESGEERVKMGYHDRTVKEWDENFWNNDNEFPNDNSLKSNQRILAYETAKKWLQLVKQTL